jgi:hypothetical protein
MTPRGACGLAVQLPIQFATCASAGWHANKSANKIAAATRLRAIGKFVMPISSN